MQPEAVGRVLCKAGVKSIPKEKKPFLSLDLDCISLASMITGRSKVSKKVWADDTKKLNGLGWSAMDMETAENSHTGSSCSEDLQVWWR